MKLIVGIGASAGGLKALESFFRAIPVDSGCCFVVVQHLSPDFKSILGDLLARHTSLPIQFAEHGMPAVPNTIFLLPPKKLLKISGGNFELSDRDIATVAELPINIFFESLATGFGTRAVGVVCSGGGSDGSLGVRAIHDAGGLVIVQRLDTAEFESMPRHALAATRVDHLLAPEDMPAVIVAYARNPVARGSRHPFATIPVETPVEGEPLVRIMALLRRISGIDFSQYKLGTVERRIERRMNLQKIPDLAAYASHLVTHPAEVSELYGDMLIGVTEFFRDTAVFTALREKILPGLVSSDRQHEVRVWVAACATGEEAYSLAILLDEAGRAGGFTGDFTIFATDVHRASLDFAATGTYARDRLKNVSPERLALYFREETPGFFRIIPEIRKRLVFARHNLVNDPPFTKLDLISCRNLLIYFNAALQERAIRLFYFALRSGGCLFLGPSEGIGRLDGVNFEILDPQMKFFRKLGGTDTIPPKFHPQPGLRSVATPISPNLGPIPGHALNRQLLAAYDHILGQYAPDGVLVSDTFEILHYFGAASRYLTPLQGRAHGSLLQRVEGDLRLCLTTLLPRVLKSGEKTSSHGVRMPGPAGDERIDVVADPITEGRNTVSLIHLSFVNPRHAPPPLPADAATSPGFIAGDELLQRINDLEVELHGTRESLQTAVEELQASNEELQSSNEELTASNEELQSTNEELHAVNEELYTVNSEFERKNTELQLLNDDLNNLSNSTDTGTVFVDRELRIRKYNAAIQRIFRLMPQDVGRPIDHIAYHLDGQEQMLQDVAWVLEHGQLRQKEVRTRDGRWLLKRVLPFLTAKGAVDGVVLTFTDIDETKSLEERLNLAMASSRLVWWDWHLPSDLLAVHCSAECILGYSQDNLPVTGKNWEDNTHPDDLPAVRAALQPCLEGDLNAWSCEHRLRMADGSWRWVLNSGKVTETDAQKRPVRMIGTTQDIHARHTAQETVHRDAALLLNIQEAIICYDANWIVTYWNRGATKLFRWTAAEMVGRPYVERFPPGPARAEAEERIKATRHQTEVHQEREDYRKDGSRVWTEVRIVRAKDAQGNAAGSIALFHDITERRHAEARFHRLVDSNVQSVIFWNKRGEITGANDAFLQLTRYTREDLDNKRISWLAMTPPEYTDRDLRALKEIAAHGVCAPYEKEWIRKDGTRVSVLLGSAIFEDNPNEGVCFALDLSTLRQAEQERRQLEQQLFQAQKMETMGLLAGGIAHDLNNILAPMLMAASLIKGKLADPRDQAMADMIETSAQRGAGIIRQLLIFSRGQEGERVNVQVIPLLEEMVHILHETFPRNLDIKFSAPPALWTVKADPTQLHQVLMNLCVNARDAMPRGGHLTLKAENVRLTEEFTRQNPPASPGLHVVLSVSDTGEGIPPEVIDRIFDPFFTTKTIGHGTGLGLSTVLGIVRNHGGIVTVYSEPGKGSIFKVYLPASDLLETGPVKAESASPFGQSELILLVDDEIPIRDSIRELLEKRHYRVLSAANGEEGLRLFAQQPESVSLVLTDMMMPVMGGLDMIRAIRALSPKVRIIATSGLDEPKRREELAALGVTEILAKPVTPAQLLKSLHRALAQPR
jgi:two-component system CheB/CheR fusion protein